MRLIIGKIRYQSQTPRTKLTSLLKLYYHVFTTAKTYLQVLQTSTLQYPLSQVVHDQEQFEVIIAVHYSLLELITQNQLLSGDIWVPDEYIGFRAY